MKRFLLVCLVAVLAFGAWSQDLSDFQAGFATFSADLAATLSYNATVGNTWSDAYIGQFPRFGAGLALGATTVPADSMEGLFTAMNISLPEHLKTLGLPIPAAAVSVKLGGLILPFDIGVKAMILPPEVTEALSAKDIAADYKLIGANLRYALVKENLVLPDISLGFGYNRMSGSLLMPTGITGEQDYVFDFNGQSTTIRVTDPELNMNCTTDSFDLTAQVSKKLLFLRPFAGAGFSFGKSTVAGGIKSELRDEEGDIIGDGQLATLKSHLDAAGISYSQFDANGFLFSAENTDPVLRVFGGLSLDLLILVVDLQGMWVPKTGSLGAQAMVRIQF